MTPQGEAFLARFDEVREAETSSFLDGQLKKVEEQCAEWNLKVVGRIADNAKNVQGAVAAGKVAFCFVSPPPFSSSTNPRDFH